MRMTVLFLAVLMLFPIASAEAQLGVPNPTTLPPSAPGTAAPKPFGTDPHPFNNSHPMQPWDPSSASIYGAPLRAYDVPAQSVEVPIEVPQPGSLPSIVEPRVVTVPGYRVVETAKGYFVSARWGLQPGSNGVYYWVWMPGYFQPK